MFSLKSSGCFTDLQSFAKLVGSLFHLLCCATELFKLYAYFFFPG